MKYLALAFLLFHSSIGSSQKKDSSLRYRWPLSVPDTMQWPVSYGWYDTVRVVDSLEGPLWAYDTKDSVVYVNWNTYRVIIRYNPPANYKGSIPFIIREYLDERKKRFPADWILKTNYELAHIKPKKN